ncbi:hypothetical protein [Streptomyces longispororuber]|uniref:hypothetical protein n=1 Tax=Streptomyces longispororuber TaxID=68230 RepID=UPI00210DF416|nr:hypothetical protein [Streptomyces longispororuber]MCQ4206971.1 hypothetical protein [Streptomyces longispororuber]
MVQRIESSSLTVDGRPLTERPKAAPWKETVTERQLGTRAATMPVLHPTVVSTT